MTSRVRANQRKGRTASRGQAALEGRCLGLLTEQEDVESRDRNLGAGTDFETSSGDYPSNHLSTTKLIRSNW